MDFINEDIELFGHAECGARIFNQVWHIKVGYKCCISTIDSWGYRGWRKQTKVTVINIEN